MKRFLVPALLALAVAACAATPAPKVAETAACPTITVTALDAQLTSHGGERKADYHGAEAQAFNSFLTAHVVDQGPETPFDEIIVWVREKAAIVVWFSEGCAIAHVAGPASALEPFIGRSA